MAQKDPRIIGERIARLRHQRDMTQVELANALGVSPSTVADWERGARFPRRKLGKVEQFFGQRLDYDEEPRQTVSVAEALDRAQAEIAKLQQVLRDEGNGGRRAG